MQLHHALVLLLITVLSFDSISGTSLTEISNNELENQLGIRNKRDAGDDNIFQLINDLVGSSLREIISGLVAPIQEVIDGIFDDVITALTNLQYTNTPQNDIEKLIANVVNSVLDNVIEIVKLVQSRVHTILDNFVVPPV